MHQLLNNIPYYYYAYSFNTNSNIVSQFVVLHIMPSQEYWCICSFRWYIFGNIPYQLVWDSTRNVILGFIPCLGSKRLYWERISCNFVYIYLTHTSWASMKAFVPSTHNHWTMFYTCNGKNSRHHHLLEKFMPAMEWFSIIFCMFATTYSLWLELYYLFKSSIIFL